MSAPARLDARRRICFEGLDLLGDDRRGSIALRRAIVEEWHERTGYSRGGHGTGERREIADRAMRKDGSRVFEMLPSIADACGGVKTVIEKTDRAEIFSHGACGRTHGDGGAGCYMISSRRGKFAVADEFQV